MKNHRGVLHALSEAVVRNKAPLSLVGQSRRWEGVEFADDDVKAQVEDQAREMLDIWKKQRHAEARTSRRRGDPPLDIEEKLEQAALSIRAVELWEKKRLVRIEKIERRRQEGLPPLSPLDSIPELKPLSSSWGLGTRRSVANPPEKRKRTSSMEAQGSHGRVNPALETHLFNDAKTGFLINWAALPPRNHFRIL